MARDRSTILVVVVLLAMPGFLLLDTPPASHDGAEVILPEAPPLDEETAAELMAGLPGHFTENRGQKGEGAGLFYAFGDPLCVAFGRGWVAYTLSTGDGGSGSMFRVRFEDADPVSPIGMDPLPHRTNFLNGPGEDRVIGVRSYREVVYEDLWTGIDLRYHFRDGLLKYDFLVAPGSDPSVIRVAFEGVEGLDIEPGSGDLSIRTDVGVVKDEAPVAYHVTPDGLRGLASRFHLDDDRTLSFILERYDPSLPLVIDPGMLFGTYLGGNDWEYITDCTFGPDGGIYVTGETLSYDFPTTSGSYIPSPVLGEYVVKLNASGSSLDFATYLNTGHFNQNRLFVDDAGGVYVAGTVEFATMTTTSGAYDTSHNGGYDVFVEKLSADGSSLELGTYIGGSSTDRASDICVDGTGCIYVVGTTWSSDFPTTSGANDTTLGGSWDGFVVKLNATGSGLVYSTYLGGGDADSINALDIDASGHAIVVGATESTDFPTTSGAYSRTFAGLSDVFVVKYEPNGTYLEYSTLFGGTYGDVGNSVQVDKDGNAYVIGSSYYIVPTTPGAYSRTNKGQIDDFLFKLDPTGSNLIFSTMFGGTYGESAWGLTVDADGSAYVSGVTNSIDFPTTEGAFCTTHHSDEPLLGLNDRYLVKFASDGSSVLYSTFIGGSGDEADWAPNTFGLGLDANGTICLAGITNSTDFPTTPGAYQTSYQGGQYDGYVVRMDLEVPSVLGDATPTVGTTADPLTFNVTALDNVAVTNVTVEHWVEGSSQTVNASMALANGTRTNGTWLLDLALPWNSTEGLSYRVHVNDSAGNRFTSGVRTIVVADNDAPLIVDGSDAFATTGDGFNFSARVVDNIDIGPVSVVYWFGGASASARNVTMTLDTVHGLANATYAHRGLAVPTDSLEPLHYYMAASDASGNWHLTSTFTVNVTDDDIPLIGPDTSDTGATTGDPFVLRITVADNVGVADVYAAYWFEGNADEPPWVVMQPDDVLPTGNGTYVLANLTIPAGELRPLHYYFAVGDTSGNFNETVEAVVTPLDDDGPVFGAETSDEVVYKGINVSLSISVSDNVGVEGAYLLYWFSIAAPVNLTLTVGPAVGASVPVPMQPSDDLHYMWLAVDAAGNWATTGVRTLVPVNDPPRLVGIDTWNVIEGTDATLDLSGHIEDLNHPVSSVTVASLSANVTVTGHVLHARYDAWVADHLVQIQLSDGENTTVWSLTVHVVNVNDPPRFLRTPGTTVAAGATYSYQVDYYDEDPSDAHTISLVAPPAGMAVDGSGLLTWTPNAGQVGEHIINLSLSDGTATVYQQWTLTVEGPANRPPAFDGSPPTAVTAGSLYSWDASATDPDDDTMYFHLQDGPDGAEMDQLSGLLTWTPVRDRKNASVNFTFQVYVTDGENVVLLSFVVTVTYPPNQAPSIVGTIPDIEVRERRQVQLADHMGDPDDPTTALTWSVEGGDGELFTATVSGSTLTIEPREGRGGSSTITLRLIDGTGDADSQTVTVRVVTDEGGGASWLPLLILIIVVAAVVAAAIVFRARGRGAGATPPRAATAPPPAEDVVVDAAAAEELAEVEAQTAIDDIDQLLEEVAAGPAEAVAAPAAAATAAAAAAAPSPAFRPTSYIVEQVFVVYRDGRLIAECAREECRTTDADLMSGMLIAIQGLIQDGLQSGGELRSINYGDNIIRMVRGRHIVLAAVVYGTPDDALTEELEQAVRRIEGSYAGVIEAWTGELEVLSGVRNLVNPLIHATAHLDRGDVEALSARTDITVLSAMDFFRGYVRLKVAAVNGTGELIADASVEVLYNRDMLRLERVEPEGLEVVGDRVMVGNVRPGERSTVAFLFDPQICQESHVDGALTYYDVRGEVHRVPMKRRKADIVCPVFFTRENANTAMLRRLIKEKLHQSDLRVFRYPKDLAPADVLRMGKAALGGDIQEVSQYVLEGPPYEAEVWYYGETKVKGFQMVMRLSVVEAKGVLEFFVASTAMEPITGLIAECRRELDRVLMERTAGRRGMTVERDEAVRRELEGRKLLMDRQGEAEIESGEAG